MELDQLEKLIKLLRKTGVLHIVTEGVTLTLSPEAPVTHYKPRGRSAKVDPFLKAMEESKDAATRAKAKFIKNNPQVIEESPVAGAPTEEDMMYWSVGGSGQ